LTRPKIGIVDDDANMRDALVALLRDNQFDPIPMADSTAYRAVEQTSPLDLLLIDLQLRDESGLTLAMDIRRTNDLPIVMLTGQGDETDKIVGLEIGADDYLLKPFNPRELVARIRAVLRRYGKPQSVPTTPRDQYQIAFGQLTVDQKQRALFDRENAEIPLTNAEYRLLEYFLSNPNKIIPRVDLLSKLGSDLTQYVDRTVDVLILRLRRKIEDNPSKPVHLQTRRGQGYIFVTDPAREPL